MSQPFFGTIMNYRKGIKTQNPSECLIKFDNVDSVTYKGQLIGRKVEWKGEKKTLFGKISSFHGKNGVMIVKFKKGVPGKAIGTKVKLLS